MFAQAQTKQGRVRPFLWAPPPGIEMSQKWVCPRMGYPKILWFIMVYHHFRTWNCQLWNIPHLETNILGNDPWHMWTSPWYIESKIWSQRICSADLQQDPIKWHKKTTHCQSFASFIGLFCLIWAKNLLENTKMDGNPCLRDVLCMAFSN